MPETVIAALISALVGLTGTAAFAAARRAGETRDILLRFGGEIRALTGHISFQQEQLSQHIQETSVAMREMTTRVGANEQRIATLEGSMERRRQP